MQPVTFVGLCTRPMPHCVRKLQMCMELKFMMFGPVNLFIFGKVSDFYCTSRLSDQNGEFFLQKYLPIIGKLSITNYSKQNYIHYKSHLTKENILKHKKVLISKISTTLRTRRNGWVRAKCCSVQNIGDIDALTKYYNTCILVTPCYSCLQLKTANTC